MGYRNPAAPQNHLPCFYGMVREAALKVLWRSRIITGPSAFPVNAMLLQRLKATPALDVLHFPTLEDFQTFERLGDSRNTPLSGRCASARAHLVLPSCYLTVQRTFPRILEVNYRTSGTVCFVPLSSSVNVTVNGVAGSASRVMTVQGEAACEIVEPQANMFAVLNLDPAISDRGWPESPDRVRIFQAENVAALRSFRHMVESLLAYASLHPAQAQATLRLMEDSLLSSLDDVMTSPPVISSPAQFECYRRIVRRMDDYLSLHLAADIYSADLARACDVSTRTLQTATRIVRGQSVHRYLRLRRLWSVRQLLATGRPFTKVSDIARANGFWHMGEFTSAYRAAFGETPSETLARSN
jgi:AraC family ethanolamine operon transcriptional activator